MSQETNKKSLHFNRTMTKKYLSFIESTNLTVRKKELPNSRNEANDLQWLDTKENNLNIETSVS